MADIEEIKIPQETVSDDRVLLVEWHFKPGSKVEKGDVVATCETSKTVIDVESPREGYLFYRFQEGQEIPSNVVLAVVAQEAEFSPDSYHWPIEGSVPAVEVKTDSGPHGAVETRFSLPALKLMEKHKVDKKEFAAGGLVTEADVKNHLASLQGLPNEVAPSALASQNGQRVVIFGGGGRAKICIDILRQTGIYEIAGIADGKLAIGSKVLGVPVVAGEDDLGRLFQEGIRMIINGVGAINNPPARETIYWKLKKIGFMFPNLIHPKAVLEPSVRVGEGNCIMAGALVGSDVTIRNNCTINSGAIISHDSVLDDNAIVAPGAILAGGVSVGRNSLVGMGCTVYLGVKIGNNVKIYNGCNIFKDVPDGAIIRN